MSDEINKKEPWEVWLWKKEVKHLKKSIEFHKSELRSFKATLHLIEDFNNWKHLMQSMKQLDDGETVEVDL